MYRVELTPRAQHELDELRKVEFERIVAVIRTLEANPRPLGVRKLRGPIYRIRVGDWRIIYAVFDKDRLVIVGKIARRSEDTYNKVDRLF
ncbi:MAG: type II toxin-antitoxin system RelE/ParE family toxin [Dehalococcoidia bacterium]|nr:type II toxin-antitoxin system RelE/ParE family toxin [Dehalococcoidia bacterium]